MNEITQMMLRMVIISIALMGPCTNLEAALVKRTKDKIEISVSLSVDQSHKNLITCVLSNRSKHTIATTNIQTSSSVFYFRMLDKLGNEIEQEPDWAKSFAQKGSERYRRPRSFRLDELHPGGTIKFQFYLEDAYGSESRNGKELIVSWESSFIDSLINTSGYLNSEGELVEGRQEKYMFPSDWSIKVSLPLKSDDEKEVDQIENSNYYKESSRYEDKNFEDTPNNQKGAKFIQTVYDLYRRYLIWFCLLVAVLGLTVLFFIYRGKRV